MVLYYFCFLQPSVTLTLFSSKYSPQQYIFELCPKYKKKIILKNNFSGFRIGCYANDRLLATRRIRERAAQSSILLAEFH
jgi:hypothetical protein